MGVYYNRWKDDMCDTGDTMEFCHDRCAISTGYHIWCLIPIHVASMILGLNLDTHTTMGYT